MICSQSTAETGSGVAVARAYCKGACCEGACRKEGSISGSVGIGGRASSRAGGRVGIGASSSKDAFRLSGVPLLLYRALSIVYSGGVGE